MRKEPVVATSTKLKQVKILVNRDEFAFVPGARRSGLIAFESLPIDKVSADINSIFSIKILRIIDKNAVVYVGVKFGEFTLGKDGGREPASIGSTLRRGQKQL